MQEREPIPDGVYLDLPMEDYLHDRALGASTLSLLAANPPDAWWQHPANPLWEPAQSDASSLGEMIHAAVIEGMHVYESRYCAPPDRQALEADGEVILDTHGDMHRWLKDRNIALVQAGVVDPLTNKPMRLKLSGAKDDLAARIREHCAECARSPDMGLDVVAPAFWDDLVAEHARGRRLVRYRDDATVRLLVRTAQADPDLSKLLADGIPEVTVFWRTADGSVRRKARLDLLRRTSISELKTFGRVSPRGLLRGFLADRVSHGDHVQAVNQMHAVQMMPKLDVIDCRAGISGDEHKARLRRFADVASGDKVFVWIGLYTGGGPTQIAVRFDRDTLAWTAAEDRIKEALARYRDYRERFGDAIWIRSEGLVAPDITDWPSWVSEPPL